METLIKVFYFSTGAFKPYLIGMQLLGKSLNSAGLFNVTPAMNVSLIIIMNILRLSSESFFTLSHPDRHVGVRRGVSVDSVEVCVNALLHLLILGKCYAVHINALSL